MCPDKELISAWYDGETDGKWMSEIKTHVESCGECGTELKRFERMSTYLVSAEVPGEAGMKDRIYAAVDRKKSVFYPEPFWKKHVEVSFPMILSAAAMLVVLAAAVVFGMLRYTSEPQIVEEITPEPEITMQVISLEDAAAYLLSDDSGFDVLITIPSSDSLFLSGEPQLIREADYRRGQ